MIQGLLYNYIYILINTKYILNINNIYIILNLILVLNTNNILNINTYCKYIRYISKEYLKYYILC